MYDVHNIHLMTGHKGNSEFCFSKDPQCSLRVKHILKGNIEVEEKQNSMFPKCQSLSVLLYLPAQFGPNKTYFWRQFMPVNNNSCHQPIIR